MALESGSPSSPPPLNLLFVTLEYKSGTFSGNGVYSKSMVRALALLGHKVFVISASPPEGWGLTLPNSSNSRSQTSKDCEHSLIEIRVPVWGRLDWKCGWKEFALNIPHELISDVVSFQPDYVLAVDWSSIDVVSKIVSNDAWKAAGLRPPPISYLNYRVYSVSEYKGEEGDKEREFYRLRESQAVGMATSVTALSSRDAEYLATELGQLKRTDVVSTALLPPLREDIRQISLEYDRPRDWHHGRRYLTCCVRLSPEKNASLFASIVAKISGFLKQENIIPLICTGANHPNEFAQNVIDMVQSSVPETVLIHGFMGPSKMAEIYSQTLLNIHPCIYDAYGMTIVESAAFGAPSLVHSVRVENDIKVNGSVSNGEADGHNSAHHTDANANFKYSSTVGATELLSAAEDLIIPLDLTSEMDRIADFLKGILLERTRLARVGLKAFRKSTSWDEKSNASKLVDILLASPS